jgi:hypothetical protein
MVCIATKKQKLGAVLAPKWGGGYEKNLFKFLVVSFLGEADDFMCAHFILPSASFDIFSIAVRCVLSM